MLEFKNKDNVIKNIDKYTNTCKILSTIRLILALALITFIIVYFSYSDSILYLSILIGIIVTISIFIPFSNKYYKALNSYKNTLEVYEIHEKRRKNLYYTFDDNGFDLKDKDDYKEADLDLFGRNSLFQYLNCCKTKYGRNTLKEAITNKQEYNEDYINTIKELSEKEESLELEASFHSFDKNAKQLEYDFLFNKLTTKIPFNISLLIPLISFIGTIVYLILCFTNGYPLSWLFVLIALNFISTSLINKNEIFGAPSIEYYELCTNYQNVIEQINKIDINTKTYQEIKDTCNKYKESLKSTKSILNILSIRQNMLFNVILNALFIFNFWLIIIFNHKNKKTEGLKDLFECVGKLECMLSLSTVGIDNEIYCVGEENDTISGDSMYHPLVKNCVDNSFNLSSGVILTGSNMSGKTTFMRTLAICETLYNANGLIPAKAFKAPKLSIYTSLRANDMLSEGISTFYAEILRMKKINQAIMEEKCLILVDEIFKGTNATERISASNQVIDKLSLNKVLFIISTHDFELCDNKNIINYHFNEQYNDDKISFDYKIKEGKSDTKNAIYLLKMANII